MTATAVAGPGEAVVFWGPPAGDGGSAVTGYTVTSNPDSVTKAAGAGATSAVVSGLSNGRAYTFSVAASNAVGVGAASSPTNQVTPIPILTVEPIVAVVEGGPGATNVASVLATLSNPSVSTVIVPFETADGTATASQGVYVPVIGGNLAIPAGNVTGQALGVVNGDDVYDLDRTFTVTFKSSTSAFVSSAASSALVTIQDDDALPVASVANVTLIESSNPSTVPVTLTGKTALGALVSYSTADTSTPSSAQSGADYTAASGAVTFFANTSVAAMSAQANVQVLQDGVDEFDEVFLVRLTSPTDATLGIAEAVVTILDADPAPRLSVLDKTVNETDGTAEVAVVLTGASNGGVSVKATVLGEDRAIAGLDFVSTTQTLTWAPDETGTKFFSVPLLDDPDIEGSERAVIALSNATTTGPSAEGVVVEVSQAELKIIDDEAPNIDRLPGVLPVGMIALAAVLAVMVAVGFRPKGIPAGS